MKFSKLLALGLCLCVLFSLIPASAADTAPADGGSDVAVATLMGLGVVSGYPDGSFHPEGSLTRAQFCKMAVLLGGYEAEVTAAGYQTLFDDVSATHWAAGYINLACQKGLVNGYGNGMFGPEDAVTSAQAAKVLLGLLGYSQSDIGPFYPEDYLSKATQVGLFDGLETADDHPLTRGEAAQMLYCLLLCETKSGQNYYRSLAENAAEDVVLLDAAEGIVTDGKTITDYRTAAELPEALEGQMGALLLDKKSRVVGFVPTETDAVTITLSTPEADRLTAASGAVFLVEEDVNVVMDEELSPFEESWFALKSGDSLTLYRDSGEVTLVVVNTAAEGVGSRLSGRIDSAAPSLKNAASVTISGCTLSLTDEGKEALKNFAIGDLVTVTLDRAGKVEQISSGAETMVGLATVTGDKAAVTLPSGTISGALTSSTQTVKNLSGSLVRVRVNSDGELTLTALSAQTYSHPLEVSARTFGGASLAGNVAVYERVGSAPAEKIDLDDILLASVPAEQIEYAGYNAAGEVDLLLLQDVTGDRYRYGILSKSTKTSGSGQMTVSNSVVSVENKSGSGTAYIVGQSFTDGAFGGVAGNDVTGKVAAMAELIAVTGLSRSDFSGSGSINGLTISPQVQVYNAATEQWVTLNQAKAYSDSFTAYLDRPAEEGGQVRIIVAE